MSVINRENTTFEFTCNTTECDMNNCETLFLFSFIQPTCNFHQPENAPNVISWC